MRSLSCHLLVLLLVAFHGLGLCHTRFVAEASDCSMSQTCGGDQSPSQDEVADGTATESCGGHGLPSVKTAAGVDVGLHVAVVAVAPLGSHRESPPPASPSSGPARFASRCLPLLI